VRGKKRPINGISGDIAGRRREELIIEISIPEDGERTVLPMLGEGWYSFGW